MIILVLSWSYIESPANKIQLDTNAYLSYIIISAASYHFDKLIVLMIQLIQIFSSYFFPQVVLVRVTQVSMPESRKNKAGSKWFKLLPDICQLIPDLM